MVTAYGYTAIIPVSMLEHPELVESHRKLMLDMLARNHPTTEGHEIYWLPEVPFRYEETGEFFAEDGEQIPLVTEVPCEVADAAYVRIVCEVMVE